MSSLSKQQWNSNILESSHVSQEYTLHIFAGTRVWFLNYYENRETQNLKLEDRVLGAPTGSGIQSMSLLLQVTVHRAVEDKAHLICKLSWALLKVDIFVTTPLLKNLWHLPFCFYFLNDQISHVWQSAFYVSCMIQCDLICSYMISRPFSQLSCQINIYMKHYCVQGCSPWREVGMWFLSLRWS